MSIVIPPLDLSTLRQHDRGERQFSTVFIVELVTHSLAAARNQLWVVAPSMLTGRRHALAAVSPVSRMIWLIHVVRGLPAGRFQSWVNYSVSATPENPVEF